MCLGKGSVRVIELSKQTHKRLGVSGICSLTLLILENRPYYYEGL